MKAGSKETKREPKRRLSLEKRLEAVFNRNTTKLAKEQNWRPSERAMTIADNGRLAKNAIAKMRRWGISGAEIRDEIEKMEKVYGTKTDKNLTP